MSDLNPDAKKLVQAGRAAFGPRPGDRERVFAALLPQLGPTPTPDAPLAPDVAPLATGTGLGTFGKISLVVVGVGILGGGLMLVAPNPAPAPISLAPSVPVVLDEAPSPPPPTPTPPPEAPTPSTTAPKPHVQPPRAPHSENRLADEVAILSRAGSALRSGQPGLALKVLDEHQRQFPSGVLAQERRAARVQALCALGRASEGVRELERLERSAPNSPHVARARKACGSAGDER